MTTKITVFDASGQNTFVSPSIRPEEKAADDRSQD